MSKFMPVVASLIAVSLPVVPVRAAVLGPHAEVCAAGRPAMLVRVQGLKTHGGVIRVQSYGGDPAGYFEKHAYLERVEARIPPSGTVEVCMPVPRSGTYAVSVRHDVSGKGGTDREDGGGMSGNPNLSLMDVVFKRRPSPAQVQIQVHDGVTPVPVVMNYVRGSGFGPIPSAR